MNCKYFGICGSCTTYNLPYETQVEKKIQLAKEAIFKHFTLLDNMQVFKSSTSHFRNRAEFRIFHEEEEISYAMQSKDN